MDLEGLQNRIEKYLGKKMTAEEQKAFEEEIKEQPELKKEVLYHMLAKEAVKISVEDEVRAKLAAIQKKEDAAVGFSFWKNPVFKLAAAACLLGLIAWAAISILSSPSKNQEYAYAEKIIALASEPISGNNLGEGNIPPWQDCLEHYDIHEYTNALRCFKEINTSNLRVQQFIAHCHMHLKQYDIAEKQFEQLLNEIQEEDTSNLRTRTRVEYNWLLSLMLQKDPRAVPIIDSLLNIPSYKYYREVQQLKQLSSSK
ncbi:MAG: hypothetical protein MI974_12550 [Chitinophagales bacterium]|nr:hypothetical protein [Chitinophagales bacterium]